MLQILTPKPKPPTTTPNYYYAYCRPNDGNQWVKFNDRIVEDVDPVIDEAAYILFFRRVNDHPRTLENLRTADFHSQWMKNATSDAHSGKAQISNSLIQPTDDTEKELLQTKFSTDGSDVILDTMICDSSCKIYVSNLQWLIEDKYLNSETINAYVLMIEAAAKEAGHIVTSFNSYFYSKLKEVNREMRGVTFQV